MNLTFLLVTLGFVALAIAGWVTVARAASGSGLELGALIVSFVLSFLAAALLIGSLCGTSGTPIVRETTEFHLERTPYRVILDAFGREAQFTDAYTVQHADRIEKVRLTVQTNAWGIAHEAPGLNAPKLVPVFAEAKAVAAAK